MIEFEKLEYKLPLDEDAHVSDSYLTSVQQNTFQEVEITLEECRESVQILTQLGKNRK